MKIVALTVFIAVYALLLIFPKYRSHVALSAAALFIVLGIVPHSEALGVIDWNVLMMLAGTMGTVDLFIRSQMPNRLSDYLVRILPNAKTLIIVLALFAGIVSAFIDNVATVLMLAPVGIAIAKKLDISPVNPIIAISVSSNLQGAATLVGDTTSILLGGHLDLNFADFFFYSGQPGMFWIVQAGALATIPVMLVLFRKETGTVNIDELTPVNDYLPTIMLVGTVLALIIASFIPDTPDTINGIICITILVVGLIIKCFSGKNFSLAGDVLKSIAGLEREQREGAVAGDGDVAFALDSGVCVQDDSLGEGDVGSYDDFRFATEGSGSQFNSGTDSHRGAHCGRSKGESYGAKKGNGKKPGYCFFHGVTTFLFYLLVFLVTHFEHFVNNTRKCVHKS
jgi:hypothetical protein